MTALVRCVEASRTFGSGSRAVVAVHAVTCTVSPGDRIAVTGPSGSGKSTLLHLLGGLTKATSGQVEWPAFGTIPSGRTDQVGLVFQGSSLVALLTVAENVALPLALRGVDPDQAVERASTVLASLGILALADRLPEEISGGQAQRTAVARVLACRPPLVLADEPTGRLDHESAVQVVDALIRTADELGAALVIATHDPRIASRLDVTWTMHDGSLAATETAGAS